LQIKRKLFYLTNPDIWGIRFKNKLYITDLFEEKEYIIKNNLFSLQKISEKERYKTILRKETVFYSKFEEYSERSKVLKNQPCLTRYISNEEILRKKNKIINYYLKNKYKIFIIKFLIKKLLEKIKKG
ncbi:hypothetical protein, partial [Cetobacterium sp.]|uniref:hypothetical protein n=1 Tax=Cetobacterium sp. TaxID=2071632 RepID=UPI002FCAD3C2